MVTSVLSNANTSFGALLIGLLCSAFLFGFITLQTYMYYRGSSRDPYVLRISAVVLWIFNVLDLGLISYAQYRYLITNFLRPQDDDVQLWSLSLHIALTAVITFVVQGFLVRRIWFFSAKNILLTAPIIPLILAPLVIHILTTYFVIHIGKFSESFRERGWLIGSLASALPADVVITALMAHYLRRGRPPTTRLVFTMTEYILQTGVLPCLVSVASFICCVTMENNLIFIAIYFLVGKLYTSSMLVILNARVSPRERGNHPTSYLTAASESTTNKISRRSTMRTNTTATDPALSTPHLHLSQATTGSIPSLELRASYDHAPGISVYGVVPNVENSVASGSGVGYTPLGQGTLTPLREESTHDRSVCSRASESSRTHWTDHNMSIESVSSKSMERPGRDLGDIEWSGDALMWQLGQSPRDMG